MKPTFALNLRTNDIFGKFFRSKQCANNAYLVSNMVFGLPQMFTADVKSMAESKTIFEDVILHKELFLRKNIVFGFARTYTFFQIWYSVSNMFAVKN